MAEESCLPKEQAYQKTPSKQNRFESERDQRYYLMKEIEEAKVVEPKANNNWRFVPSQLAEPAIKRDKELLFGKRIKQSRQR